MSVIILVLASVQAVLIVLVGIIVAVVFDGGARAGMFALHLSRRLSLSLVLMLVAALLGAALWWCGSGLFDQLQGL